VSKSMNTCERLRETLVADGRAGIEQDASLEEHVKTCAECKRLLQAWSQIPGLLEQLPDYEPEETLVRKVIQKLPATGGGMNRGRRRFIAPSLASAAVLLAAIGLSRELLLHEAPKAPVTMQTRGALGQSTAGPDAGNRADGFEHPARKTRTENMVAGTRPVERDRLEESPEYREDQSPMAAAQPKSLGGEVSEADTLADARSNDDRPSPASGFAGEIPARSKTSMQQPTPQRKLANERFSGSAGSGTVSEQPFEEPSIGEKKDHEYEAIGPREGTDQDRSLDAGLESAAVRPGSEYARTSGKAESAEQDAARAVAPVTEVPEPAIAGGGPDSFRKEGKTKAAFDFLGYYGQTGNLEFQPATGYWANTYIPGDPEIRWLSARLAQWDRSWLPSQADLEQAVRPVGQPFDAPDDNALALSLMSDANAVRSSGPSGEPTRLRVQVGIRAIEHRRGQRPAMNVGVVVDLPADAPDTVRIASRALLDALLQSKQAGDRFSLVVAGQPGKTHSLVLPAGDFRFGPLQLAEQIILGQDVAGMQADEGGADRSGPDLSNLDLYGAIEHAGDMVQQNDDPSRPLGSSSVLLISARNIENLDRLVTLIHQRAKEGITLSVFPLGNQAQSSQTDQLVLAGLGNRHFLEAPEQARQLIEEELHSSSRAVARAVRLSIRLAPGVQLIDVVGSERLDTRQAQRVREIENSMDRRLSANLGIQADRGEDEQGIQILIPGIYSGDDVTVLLDVVTDRPGAIADVSLRYKDLVFLRNGSLQGHLDLPEGELRRGPAELAVLKNLLSHHFVMAVQQAATALGRGQADEATGVLRAMHATLDQVRQAVPAWASDPDLVRDQKVLERYIAALASPQANAHQVFLRDSLKYAAWAKTHRGPMEWKQ